MTENTKQHLKDASINMIRTLAEHDPALESIEDDSANELESAADAVADRFKQEYMSPKDFYAISAMEHALRAFAAVKRDEYDIAREELGYARMFNSRIK